VFVIFGWFPTIPYHVKNQNHDKNQNAKKPKNKKMKKDSPSPQSQFKQTHK